MTKKLIPIREASGLLNVSIDTLRRWDESGKLIAVRTGKGGHRYYRQEDIDQYFSNIFSLAKSWAFSSTPTEPEDTYYCQISSVFQARLATMENTLRQFGTSGDISPLITAITGEIGNNSFDHNLGNWPDISGIFFGYDPTKRMVVLADRGRGILETLKKVRPELENHNMALEVAFTEIVSGRAPEARGNGLKFVKQVVTQNPISLIYQTGDAKLELGEDAPEIIIQQSEDSFHGCLALIRF